MEQHIPEWWPTKAPLYDIEKTYAENRKNGPVFDGPIPVREWPESKDFIDFLGVPVASRLGVPAGPLLDSQGISLAADLGYDLLTYKTIRTHEYDAHPLPNICYLNTGKNLEESGIDLLTRSEADTDIEKLAITNSFGNPSMSQEFLRKDFAKAEASLRLGQALILSIFGSEASGKSMEEDFIDCAYFARELNAKIVEANFSCPNVARSEGALYEDPKQVFTLAKQLVDALSSTPLILKMGVFPSKESLREVLHAARDAGVRAVSGINTLSRKVHNSNGQPALGPERLTSGVCGGPIRNAGLNFVRWAREIIEEDQLKLTLIGVGGVVLPQHFQDFLDSGADFVMTATGMMWDPYLASKYHQNILSLQN
ncbi:MAG: dihydroorotate dehydrogenase [Waddliaceae bacterium]|nr:dihydroorotate dehydrogenase [Waddliaceae bacterium]